jgi:hypothetical protein
MRPLLPTNVLVNPYFAGGSSANWILEGPGWVIGTGAPYGDGHLANFTGPGTAAIVNQTRIVCIPGALVKGQCWALGEIGATGAATLRLIFWDANNNFIRRSNGNISYDSYVSPNYVWQLLTVYGNAPTNVAYATIDFAVYNSTGGAPRWGATSFFGANLLGQLGRTALSVKQPLKYYLNLFTSQYKGSAKLNQWQAALMQPIDDLTNCLQTIDISFDIDNAFGSQLDVVGEIIGVSRTLSFQPSGGVSPVLTDDDYKLLLYATQAKNTWDGTIESIYRIWQFLFPNGLLAIIDNQNMTATITTSGSFSSIEQDLITNGYIVPRPEGVQYNASGGGITTGLFGFDRNDSTVAGFDVGKFA